MPWHGYCQRSIANFSSVQIRHMAVTAVRNSVYFSVTNYMNTFYSWLSGIFRILRNTKHLHSAHASVTSSMGLLLPLYLRLDKDPKSTYSYLRPEAVPYPWREARPEAILWLWGEAALEWSCALPESKKEGILDIYDIIELQNQPTSWPSLPLDTLLYKVINVFSFKSLWVEVFVTYNQIHVN